ncbi:hypothetical protein C8Q78DRAFT_747272 [Trametes maxima]|nr:hypothetical protein C8Q78DRAFT_747272 [Trametes maxima]
MRGRSITKIRNLPSPRYWQRAGRVNVDVAETDHPSQHSPEVLASTPSLISYVLQTLRAAACSPPEPAPQSAPFSRGHVHVRLPLSLSNPALGDWAGTRRAVGPRACPVPQRSHSELSRHFVRNAAVVWRNAEGSVTWVHTDMAGMPALKRQGRTRDPRACCGCVHRGGIQALKYKTRKACCCARARIVDASDDLPARIPVVEAILRLGHSSCTFHLRSTVSPHTACRTPRGPPCSRLS